LRASARLQRRTRRSLGSRLRTYSLPAIALLGPAVWGGWWLANLPAFHLQSLVVTGLSRVTEPEVVARAAIDPQANVWFLDRAAVRHRIEAIPYVETARIHVRPQAAVWIEVSERTAEACVRDAAGNVLTVDAALRVLETGCSSAKLTYEVRSNLPAAPGTFLHDPELIALQSDARTLARNADRYRAFSHDSFGELEATMQDGIRVRFGDDDDLDRKQRLIAPILAQLGPRAGDVRAVDLRAPDAPVVEYRH